MLDVQTMRKLQNELTSLLVQLRAGEIDCIEYGDPKAEVGGYMSFFRIYYMNTARGIQFCYKELIYHVEGSGIYNHDLEETLDYALNRVLYYDRPTALRLSIESRRDIKRASLTFYPLTKVRMTDSHQKGQNLAAYRLQHLDKEIPNMETVILPDPSQ